MALLGKLFHVLQDPFAVGRNADEALGQHAAALAQDLAGQADKDAFVDSWSANIAGADALASLVAQAEHLVVGLNDVIGQTALAFRLNDGVSYLQSAVHIGFRILGAAPAGDVDKGAQWRVLCGQGHGADVVIEHHWLAETQQSNASLQFIVVGIHCNFLHAYALTAIVQIHCASRNHK